jgi:cyanate permease
VDEGWALGLGWLVFTALLAVLVWFVLRERE